ncbi:hypothetical protein [Hyalangium rubrum]|uniref:Lipoprotein n=1 Tax=Hyalangium rubrum TaxID=3103134 RepID=A0ABU5H6U4_9BACT|nr:hypothetical protein [Hyalangium sp. s54d21]MDY7229065.1 hypothetical protein [Hyalangium sp. s54d21]
MGPMLPLAGALVLASSPVQPCYTPSDQTAGWKRVELLDEAPALAAPRWVEQFRAGERAQLTEVDPPNTYLGATERNMGRMRYTFRVPMDASRMEVDFLSSLDGAKVDVTAYVGARAYPLLSERRQHGPNLSIDWIMAGVDTVTVEVHHHLRHRPVVRHWRVVRQVVPSQEVSIPTAFQAPRALYFLHPGGQHIELCNTPHQLMHLSRLPQGAPVDVTLRRARSEGP